MATYSEKREEEGGPGGNVGGEQVVDVDSSLKIMIMIMIIIIIIIIIISMIMIMSRW